ncbi:hypothetical protein QEN19_001325 [Hanseniaspora menglaensis]
MIYRDDESSKRSKVTDAILANLIVSNDESPIFPPIDKNLLQLILKEQTFKHCLYDSSTLTCYMELAEDDIIYMPRIGNTNRSNAANSTDQKPPVLRGHIVVKIKNPTRLKEISLTLNGHLKLNFSRQAIDGLNDMEFTSKCVTECDILNHSWPFYRDSDKHITNKNCEVFYSLQEIHELREQLKQEEGENNEFYSAEKHSHLIRHRAMSIASDRINEADLISNLDYDEQTNSLKQMASPAGSIFGAIKTFLTASPSQNVNGLFETTTNNSMESAVLGRKRSSTIKSQDRIHTLNSVKSNSSFVSNTVTDTDVFQPGYYVYSFEYLIPLIFPETVKTDMASIVYRLNFFVERIGAFKSNIDCSRELHLIRIPNIDSVEESEPIAVLKEWDNSLKYEILISSKDVILNAFLPVKINLTPIDKCSVHRIRVYITENIEMTAYADSASKYDPITGKKKKKKLTTEAPQKKFLISEYKAPPLKDLKPGELKSKAKNLGNLLCEDPSDPKHSFLSYQEFPLQIYIPEYVNNSYKLSANIATNNIKITHSLKINLRLSKNNQHFEISIDTPIIVQHKLSTHTTTLLPPYDQQTKAGLDGLISSTNHISSDVENYYHKNPINLLSANIYNQPEAYEDDLRLTSPQAVPMNSNVKLPDFEEVLTLNSPAMSSDVSLAIADEWPNIEDVLLSPDTNYEYMSECHDVHGLYSSFNGLNQRNDLESNSLSLDGILSYPDILPPSYDEFLASQNIGPLSPKINPEIFGTNDDEDPYISKDLDEFDVEDLSDSEDDLGCGYLENRENPFI